MLASFIWFVSSVAAPAAAGTLRVQATSPVTYRVDGEVVARVTPSLTLTDIAAGAHSIEVLDSFGKVLASTSVVLLEDVPLVYQYTNHRLLRVDSIASVAGDRTPLTDVQYEWIEHRVSHRRRDDKRLKRLAEVVDDYWFEMRHVDKLLMAFETIEGRVMATTLMAPRTVDPERTKAIEDHFPEGTFRDRAMAAFAIYK